MIKDCISHVTFFSFVFVVIIFGHSTSYADVDVCGTVRFWDDRTVTSNANGSFLPQLSGDRNKPMLNIDIHIMDQDGACIDDEPLCSESDDDLLGIVTTSSVDGSYCLLGVGLAEDVYLKTEYKGEHFEILPDSITAISTSTRVEVDISTNITFDWNVTCPDDDENNVNGWCDNQFDVTFAFPDQRIWAVQAASVERVFQAFTSSAKLNQNDNPVKIYYPDGPLLSNNVRPCARTNVAGASWGFDSICVGNGDVRNNHTIAHEVGHLIHRRAMDDSNALNSHTDGAGNSVASCSSGATDWWTNQSPLDGEKCTTSEGWAHFVAVASHFSKTSNGTGGYPFMEFPARIVEGSTTQGNGSTSRDCINELSNPENARGNATRWFWDLYDDHVAPIETSAQDNASYSLSQIVGVWDSFNIGSANGETAEANVDGRNAWDYEDLWSGAHTEIILNCLDDQVPH